MARQFLRRIMVMYDKDWGYVSSSEPQTLRQALTSSMSFYKYQSTNGDNIKGEKLEYVYIISMW